MGLRATQAPQYPQAVVNSFLLQVYEEMTGWTSVRLDELSKKVHLKTESFKSVRAATRLEREGCRAAGLPPLPP